MSYSPLTIILTIIGLYLVSYILITLFTFIYLGFTKNSDRVKGPKVFLATSIVALAWVVATLVSVMVAQSLGITIFSILALGLIFAGSYLFVRKTIGIDGKTRILYSILIAVIFNPGWLFIFKVL